MKRALVYLSFIGFTTFCGCLSVAKIDQFPKSSAGINFERYATEFQENKDPFWTFNTSNEYYFERDTVISEQELIDVIQYALRNKEYSINSTSAENDNVNGKRGMYANEWKTITGVYYRIDLTKHKLQIYTKTQITQDITGGWRKNRAKEVSLIIEERLDTKQ